MASGWLLAAQGRRAVHRGPVEVHRDDAQQRHHVLHGAGRDGKDVSGRRRGGLDAQAKQIRRIVLARPAVEAGEKLGFLPGDIAAKVNPYLRPLFDALEDMMDFAQMRKFMELDIIEIIPLAFMRGRTLNEAAIICDEAQNTSGLQMLMVLTRLGHGSKMIITGDITQVDLAAIQRSGMVDAIEILKGMASAWWSCTARTSSGIGWSRISWRPTKSSSPRIDGPRPCGPGPET